MCPLSQFRFFLISPVLIFSRLPASLGAGSPWLERKIDDDQMEGADWRRWRPHHRLSHRGADSGRRVAGKENITHRRQSKIYICVLKVTAKGICCNWVPVWAPPSPPQLFLGCELCSHLCLWFHKWIISRVYKNSSSRSPTSSHTTCCRFVSFVNIYLGTFEETTHQ